MTFIEVPGPPVPKARPRRTRAGQWYTPHTTRIYEQHVALRAQRECRKPGHVALREAGPMEVTIRFYLPDRRRRDIDNCVKSVLDGLNGVAWDDDSQVVRLTVEKSVDRAHPRAEIVIGGARAPEA